MREHNASGQRTNTYVHGVSSGDDPLIHYPGTSAHYTNAEFFYADRLGSIVASFNRNGAVKAINSYDEFGVPGAASGTQNAGRFRYTGQIYIPELGQYHYKARAYSPSLGRFMPADPIGYGDGLNMYAHVGNDPVNLIDPTGFQSVDPGIFVRPCPGSVPVRVDGHLRCDAGGGFFGLTTVFKAITLFPEELRDLFEPEPEEGEGEESETTVEKIARCLFEAGSKNGVNILLDGGGLVLALTPVGRAGTTVVGLSLSGGSLAYNAAMGNFAEAGLAGVSYTSSAVEPQVAISRAAATHAVGLELIAKAGGAAAFTAAGITAAQTAIDFEDCFYK